MSYKQSLENVVGILDELKVQDPSLWEKLVTLRSVVEDYRMLKKGYITPTIKGWDTLGSYILNSIFHSISFFKSESDQKYHLTEMRNNIDKVADFVKHVPIDDVGRKQLEELTESLSRMLEATVNVQ